MDKITINLNMFGMLMKNKIGGNLNSTSVISIKWGRGDLRKPKLLEKTAQPYNFRTSRHIMILGLNGGFKNMIVSYISKKLKHHLKTYTNP